jgi:hypothetical protein
MESCAVGIFVSVFQLEPIKDECSAFLPVRPGCESRLLQVWAEVTGEPVEVPAESFDGCLLLIDAESYPRDFTGTQSRLGLKFYEGKRINFQISEIEAFIEEHAMLFEDAVFGWAREQDRGSVILTLSNGRLHGEYTGSEPEP